MLSLDDVVHVTPDRYETGRQNIKDVFIQYNVKTVLIFQIRLAERKGQKEKEKKNMGSVVSIPSSTTQFEQVAFTYLCLKRQIHPNCVPPHEKIRLIHSTYTIENEKKAGNKTKKKKKKRTQLQCPAEKQHQTRETNTNNAIDRLP